MCIYESGDKVSNENIKFCQDDVIITIVEIPRSTITFYINGRFAAERKINTRWKYRFAVQAIGCKISLIHFEFVKDVKDIGLMLITGFVKKKRII